MKNSLVIPIAIIVGGAIVASAVYFSVPKAPATQKENSALLRPVSPDDHILGNPAAPVIIVEYSDFDCTYCKDFHETLHQIIANEGATGKVAWVFREFPLTEIHPNALAHARAAECAAKTSGNEAFWNFADALFKKQPVDPKIYGSIASAAGISSNAFATCVANAAQTVDARIMADRQNALDIGSEGTPYSIILVAGKPPIVMNGRYPYDAIRQIIEDALAD